MLLSTTVETPLAAGFLAAVGCLSVVLLAVGPLPEGAGAGMLLDFAAAGLFATTSLFAAGLAAVGLLVAVEFLAAEARAPPAGGAPRLSGGRGWPSRTPAEAGTP
jgi:hypothetical protein